MGEKLLLSEIAETLLFDQAIYRTRLEQNLPRCHENFIGGFLTLAFYVLVCQILIKKKKKKPGADMRFMVIQQGKLAWVCNKRVIYYAT